MRDLIRLLSVGIMSFAIVAIAMVYSRGGDLQSAIQPVTQAAASLAAQASQSLGQGASAAETDAEAEGYTYSVTRPNAARWVGLAGFPDQSEVSFPLPGNHHYRSGTLKLRFETQLTQHGDGLLTLSVNRTERGQIVLDSGQAVHDIDIALTPQDLAGDRIVLHMAGRGTTSAGQICPTDAINSGSAVTLSAQSSLELTSDQTLSDGVGALAAAPQPFVIAQGSDAADRGMAIWAAQQFNRAGLAARIGDAGAGETPMRVASHAVTSSAVAPGNLLVGQEAVRQVIEAYGSSLRLSPDWPVSVTDLGADTAVKSFRGSRRWTIQFNAADLPGGGLPESFALRLAATPLAGSSEWVVRLLLNGNLVDSHRLPGGSKIIELAVALPAERLLPQNGLVVELVDTTPNESICSRGLDAQAQLLPESALIDSAPADMAWAQLIEQLAGLPALSLTTSDGLDAAQANRAGDMLAAILPRTIRLSQDEGPVQMMVTDRSGLTQALLRLADQGEVTAILPDAGDGGRAPIVVAVPGPGFGIALERLGANDVILLATGL